MRDLPKVRIWTRRLQQHMENRIVWLDWYYVAYEEQAKLLIYHYKLWNILPRKVRKK